MKVRIGPYKHWFGPYQLADMLCFWMKEDDKRAHKFGEWLAYGKNRPEPKVGELVSLGRTDEPTWLYKFMLWIHELRGEQKIIVKLDRWDTWSADHTLGYIILPVLKQLKKQKQGSPFVDIEDVPDELRVVAEDEYGTDPLIHERWEYVLDEMIFAFETKVGMLQDWEDMFHHGGDFSMTAEKLESGYYRLHSNGSVDMDMDGLKEMQARISNGFRLFGKYYEALWT